MFAGGVGGRGIVEINRIIAPWYTDDDSTESAGETAGLAGVKILHVLMIFEDKEAL